MTVIFNNIVKTSSQMNISGCHTQAYRGCPDDRCQKIKIIKKNVPYLHVQFATS